MMSFANLQVNFITLSFYSIFNDKNRVEISLALAFVRKLAARKLNFLTIRRSNQQIIINPSKPSRRIPTLLLQKG